MQAEASKIPLNTLTALSPLDGRYRSKVSILSSYFSESALMRARVQVELVFLKHFLRATAQLNLSEENQKKLMQILSDFSPADAARIKTIESTTHHDVKAVEYFLQEKCNELDLKQVVPYIHFGITSEDTNNLAYRVLIAGAHVQVLLPALQTILQKLGALSSEYAALPMLARTHGQPALPTTLGKEFSVFGERLLRQLRQLDGLQLTGKLTGAVGGYHALHLTHPDVDWRAVSHEVITELGLRSTTNTTQIAPPEDILELLSGYQRINGILLDLSTDMWRYISDDWLIQKGKHRHVGSSTMPQKINPIEFENAEGNLTLANGFMEVVCRKLPQSRLQRDLSESTIARNYGVLFGHALLGYTSLVKGLESIAPNTEQLHAALHHNWNILSEAAQVVARGAGDAHGYEHAATAFKGTQVTKELWQSVIQPLDTPARTLSTLTPETYLGYSTQLARETATVITTYLEEVADEKHAATV